MNDIDGLDKMSKEELKRAFDESTAIYNIMKKEFLKMIKIILLILLTAVSLYTGYLLGESNRWK